MGIYSCYEVEELIGYGGMGAVYRARDTTTSREVAIKMLRTDALHDKAYVARFTNESKNLRRVNHPNVVRIFDEGKPDGCPFLVMELLEGHTLASTLEKPGPMPFADVVRIMEGICAGVQAVHEEGLVHRDPR
ncbi:MAG: serine/threonine protein kinase [Deltaproteobacteria bacterium]|nr:serine/threonine protein kinase [Deltaproteobacteria bacterium]